jgi:hypothetical protein
METHKMENETAVAVTREQWYQIKIDKQLAIRRSLDQLLVECGYFEEPEEEEAFLKELAFRVLEIEHDGLSGDYAAQLAECLALKPMFEAYGDPPKEPKEVAA